MPIEKKINLNSRYKKKANQLAVSFDCPEEERDEPRMVPQIGHMSAISGIQLSRDSRYLLTYSESEVFAILWEVASGRILRKYELGESIRSATFSAQSNLVALGGENTVKIFSIWNEKPQRSFPPLDTPCDCMVFSYDENYLFFPGNKNDLFIAPLFDDNTQASRSAFPERSALEDPSNPLSFQDYSEYMLKSLDINATGNLIFGGISVRRTELVNSKHRKWKGMLWQNDWFGLKTSSATYETTDSKQREELGNLDLEKMICSWTGQYLLIWLKFPRQLKKTRKYQIYLYKLQNVFDGGRVNGLGVSNVQVPDIKLSEKNVWRAVTESNNSDFDFAYFSDDSSYILLGRDGKMYSWDLNDVYPTSGEGKNEGIFKVEEQVDGYHYPVLEDENTPAIIFTPDLEYYFQVANSNEVRPVVEMRRACDGRQIRRFKGIGIETDQKNIKAKFNQVLKRSFNVFNEIEDQLIEHITGQGSPIRFICCPDHGEHLHSDDDPSYLFYHTDPHKNFYACHKKFAKEAIAFVVNNRAYDFDQFDLWYNQPHEILKPLKNFLGSSPIDLSRKVFETRLSLMKVTKENTAPRPALKILSPVPIDITNEKNRNLNLEVGIQDESALLDRLDVWVNGVPVYGTGGFSLRERYTLEAEVDIIIPLSKGKNYIRLSARNEKGLTSLAESFMVYYEQQKPDLWLYAIGVSKYLDGQKDPQFADRDAKDLKDLQFAAKDAKDLTENYKKRAADKDKFFGMLRSRLLINEKATSNRIKAIKEELRLESKTDDTVIIFFSGHGVRDISHNLYLAPHDMDFTNPEEKGISYQKISDLFDGIPARNKLLILDACFTGELGKKSIRKMRQPTLQTTFEFDVEIDDFDHDIWPDSISWDEELDDSGEFQNDDDLEEIFRQMRTIFADLRPHSGTTVITSSAGDKRSFEDPELQNGIFTDHLLKILDDRGPLEVKDLFQEIDQQFKNNEENRQKPELRMENLESDFRIW